MDKARVKAAARLYVLRHAQRDDWERAQRARPPNYGGYGLAEEYRIREEHEMRRRHALDSLLRLILGDELKDERQIDAEARIYEQEEIAQARRDDAFPEQKRKP